MKGTIFDIKRFAIHDGPGIRTTVFLKGCPLRCPWCHNPESQSPEIIEYDRTLPVDGKLFTQKETIGRIISVDELMQDILRDGIYFEESGGGITFSGGEPLFQPGFLLETLERCYDNGLHVCIDTCGYAEREVIEQVMKYTGQFLYDLKLIDNDRHSELTGQSNDLPLKNLLYLAGSGADVVIRFPLVPGKTDDMDNLRAISQLMHQNKLTRIDILPFHGLGSHKYRKLNMEITGEPIRVPRQEEVDEALQFFRNSGFEVSVGG